MSEDVLNPPPRYNRPGQTAISYRAATHPEALRRLLARLPAAFRPQLARSGGAGALTTRAPDDPSIALLDAWAAVLDVIAFYQERIANEGYLATATERRSVLELARTIGYELAPGVAAGAYLAFTVEGAAGAPGRATVEPGVRVLSVPGQGERPQTFETVEGIEARATWNALRPRQREAQRPGPGATDLYLSGTTTLLGPGDPTLLAGPAVQPDPRDRAGEKGEGLAFRTLRLVEPDPLQGHTRVTWDDPLTPAEAREGLPAAFAFRQRASLFGHNAPDYRAMAEEVKRAYQEERREPVPGREERPPAEWPGFRLQVPDGGDPQIDLDTVYPRVLAGTWAVLSRPGLVRAYPVKAVDTAQRTDYTLTAKTTRLTLDATVGRDDLAQFGLRETVVFVQGEALPLAERPLTRPVEGRRIELQGQAPDVHAGQALILRGAEGSEVAVVEGVEGGEGETVLRLSADLSGRYARPALEINANVARATHGETVPHEVLGSGDGGQANQLLRLRRPPLTYVSAPTATGARSTLSVRVDTVEWEEVPSLFGLDPRREAYTVRLEDDGTTRVVFGDGRMGARLPSGTENVSASYRSGIGPEGNVRAGSLTLLQTRPLGVREVTNPLPATGGAPPEALEDARANAPLTVLTLERIVALKDFEDFARAFAGIGKAAALTLWNGRANTVHVTVGGADGEPLDPGAALFANLKGAIDASRDPSVEVFLQSFVSRDFTVAATILVAPRFEAGAVLAAAGSALRETFAFARRAFGQSVTAAEVITALQSVRGVEAVDLDRLAFADERRDEGPGAIAAPPAFLPAARATWPRGAPAPRPAELLRLDPQDPGAVTLAQMERPA